MNKIHSIGRAVLPVGGAIALVAPLTGPATAAARSDNRAATAKLQTLTCYETESVRGGDDVYVQVNGKTIWRSGDSLNCDHNAPTKRQVNRLAKPGDTVTLYEDDHPESDDPLGSDTVEVGRGTLTFNLDDALYSLVYGPA